MGNHDPYSDLVWPPLDMGTHAQGEAGMLSSADFRARDMGGKFAPALAIQDSILELDTARAACVSNTRAMYAI